MSEPAYRPIACADHERLEFAALKKHWLELCVDGVVQPLLPLDVFTRGGAEWLRARNEKGEDLMIRLDEIKFSGRSDRCR